MVATATNPIETGKPCSMLDNTEPKYDTCGDSDHCVSSCAAYGKVCPCHAQAAGRAACKRIGQILCESKVFEDGEPSFRKVNQSEVIMFDKLLGEGGFSKVNACAFKEDPDNSQVLAIKYLKRQAMVERKTFEYGASDLANEAFFLAKLDHPNVVKLHAVTQGSLEKNISAGKDGGYFIIVDRLVETLDQRIEKWQIQAEEIPHSLFYRLSREYKEKQRSFLKDRVQVALEIAKVMEYLHSLDILFRDLKPDNIGFDANGTLKLFDFGLAKEEKPCDAVEDGKYKMTGHTGSRRYMAPEVAMDRPYNRSVDVYSFGILLWEMCSLEKPFAGYNSKKHMRDVVIAGERPKMDHSHTTYWPADLQWLITSSWSSKSEMRPTFTAIRENLQNIMGELDMPYQSNRIRARSEGSTVDRQTSHGSDDACISPTRKGPRLFNKIPRMISRS
jgi:serine/threonine protein kinase